MDVANSICPACFCELLDPCDGGVRCSSCLRFYPIDRELIDFRLDLSRDTQLDVADYASEHSLDPNASANLYRVYENILRDHGTNTGGTVLEVASGAGNLSAGLVSASEFSSIHCSDISPDFMRILRKKLSESTVSAELTCHLFDANSLPFKSETFDAVLGNSVLHHFADFENTLRESFRVLGPAGSAVFGEPVLDTHAFASLAASLILTVHDRYEAGNLSARERQALIAVAQRASQKRKNLMLKDRSELTMEDKFQFPVAYMENLSRELGFRRFRCISPVSVVDLGDTLKSLISMVFRQVQADPAALDAYQFIFDDIDSTYGTSMRHDLKAPFSFFLFQK